MITNENTKISKPIQNQFRIIWIEYSLLVFQDQEKQKHQTNFGKIYLYGEDRYELKNNY